MLRRTQYARAATRLDASDDIELPVQRDAEFAWPLPWSARVHTFAPSSINATSRHYAAATHSGLTLTSTDPACFVHAGILCVAVCLAGMGSLGDPFPPDVVAFDAVAREHFDAMTVSRGITDSPLLGVLVVRVRLMGDGADADTSRASTWLLETARIRLEASAEGAPLYLTREDLAATSGRATLGATLPRGMAVEVGNAGVAPCVLAHEVLHLVGLKHVPDRRNIMQPHCSGGFLDRAHFDEDQYGAVARVERISALTPRGVETWANREGG